MNVKRLPLTIALLTATLGCDPEPTVSRQAYEAVARQNEELEATIASNNQKAENEKNKLIEVYTTQQQQKNAKIKEKDDEIQRVKNELEALKQEHKECIHRSSLRPVLSQLNNLLASGSFSSLLKLDPEALRQELEALATCIDGLKLSNQNEGTIRAIAESFGMHTYEVTQKIQTYNLEWSKLQQGIRPPLQWTKNQQYAKELNASLKALQKLIKSLTDPKGSS